MARVPHDVRHHPDYRPPESPATWHRQDWLLVLAALNEFAWSNPDDLTDGQELRACQLASDVASMCRTPPIGARQAIDVDHFEEDARANDRGEEPGDNR